jgi:universal stress protein A
MAVMKKILVPTDFSKFSDKALKQAVEMAKQNKAKIYLLHVVGVVQQCAVDYCLDQQTIDALDKKSIKSSEDMMQKQIKKVVNSRDVEIISYVVKGTPYHEILKEQEDKKIDLIVIATHGRTGLIGHLLGSVAEKVVRHAKCPVFLVRGK